MTFRDQAIGWMSLSALALLAAIPPEALESAPVLCAYRNLLGWNCPGCGMTRAVAYLLHGNVAAAADRNLLVILVFPLLCFLSLRSLGAFFSAVRQELKK